MGIFGSRKKLISRSDKDTFEVIKEAKPVKKKKTFGLKKFFSVMYTAPETKKKTYVDVYNRPTFAKSLKYEPGKGYSSVDEDYAARLHGPVKTTGFKRIEYYRYDFDSWNEEEIAKYDIRFNPIALDDEVADTMKIALKEIGEDEMEIEDFGHYSEADIRYEEIEIPMAKPDFLPDAIKEETVVEEEVEIPIVEEIPIAEETKVEEQPIQLEAPVTVGLLTEPAIEEMNIEVVEPVRERNIFSFGFGNVPTEQKGPVTLSFGFGSQEIKDEGSAFVSNAVFSVQNAETNVASF